MTLDQLTLLTLIIPQVHFNYSSASCMFLSPFSFTWPTPSLFLFLQMSCCTEEVYILSCSKPKPSPTPQNYSSDCFLWLVHSALAASDAFIWTPDENSYQTGYFFIYRLTVLSICHASLPLILSLEAEVELYHSVHGENLVSFTPSSPLVPPPTW